MSHERRVGVRFESRARGALRGPRAALHRVAGRAPAARPCVRLIAIGEAVWPCVRLIAIGEAVLDSHVLDDSCVPYYRTRVPRGAPGTATAAAFRPTPQTRNRLGSYPQCAVAQCVDIRIARDCGNASRYSHARQTPNAKRNRETPLFHPPRRAGRARARAVGVRRMR